MVTRTLTDTATVSWDENPAGRLNANVVDDSIYNAKLANMVQATIKGRAAAAGTGDPTDLTPAEIGAILGIGTPGTGVLDLTEIAAPASPASNVARTYAVDNGAGVTTLAMKDATGNVVPLSHFLQAGSGTVTRTQQAKARDLISIKDWGAVGDSTTDDTTAVTAADADTNAEFMPTGVYDVTLTASDLDGPYWGRGQIRDSVNNLRGPWFSAIKAAPSSFGIQDSISTAYNGDLSKVQIAMEHRITGAATLGTPATGYSFYPEAGAIFARLFNSSGHNEATASNDGRTMAQLANLRVDNAGQGDCSCIYAFGTVQGTRSGSTHFLANPAVSIIAGQVDAFTDGTYLNPYEIAMNDNGFDVAGIGWVVNMNRTVATGAKTACWIGYRSQSTGSADVNSHFSAAGPCDVGLDFTAINTDASLAAIALLADDRIYGNASSSNGFYATALGDDYLSFNGAASAWDTVINGERSWRVEAAGVGSVRSVDAGAGGGPFLLLNRESPTPAAADDLGFIVFNGRDSGGNETAYAAVSAAIIDPTNGSEDGQLLLRSIVAGTLTNTIRVGDGVQIGAPGAYMGAGTLNTAGAIYRSGTQVLGARVTGWTAATGTKVRTTFVATAPTAAEVGQRLGALIDDLIAHGIIGA